jgi:hypothetical protein
MTPQIVLMGCVILAMLFFFSGFIAGFFRGISYARSIIDEQDAEDAEFWELYNQWPP